MLSHQTIRQGIRLLRRELRHGLRGFGVFLSCLFLGVFAISAIGNFSQAARQGLLQDAAALLGGDLEIRQVHRPLDEQRKRFIADKATLSTVTELRTMATVEDSGERALIELKAVDDSYPLYGRVRLASGQALAKALSGDGQRPGVVVEQNFLKRFDGRVGSTVSIGAMVFTVTDVILVEPDRSLRAFTLGPRVMMNREALEKTGLVQPGSLVNYAYRLKFRQQALAEQFKSLLHQTFPEAGWRIRSWNEVAPRVRFFLDRMETNLSLLGLCSLLVGGLGVSGAVRGYLTSKRDHIATLKCLGATGRLIFTTYLMQIMLLGFFASALGLLAGAALPWLLVKIFGQEIPLPLAPGFYPSIWISTSLFGLLTALLFSLREIGRACRVTPATLFRGYSDTANTDSGRKIWLWIALSALSLITVALLNSVDKRLALWFIIGAVACILTFRLLAWGVLALVARLPRPRNAIARLALANMKRPGAPASGMIFSLGIGLTALVMIVQVQNSLDAMVTETLPSEAPAYFFFDIQPHQLDQIELMVKNNAAVTAFNHSPTLRGRITAINDIPVEQARIDPSVRWAVRGDRFLSYAAQPPDNSSLTAGNWWPPDYDGPPLLSLTADLAKGFGLKLGDTLSVNILGREVRATIANIRSVDWSTLELNFALLFAPGTLEKVPQTHIAAVHLPAAAEDSFYRQVTGTYGNISALSVREILANVSRTLTRIGWAFKGMAAIVLLTGLLVLIGAISADQHQRVRDAVIYKVCGATRRKILLVFGCEFILIGLVTAAMSLLVGSLAAFAILQGPLDADYRTNPFGVALTFASGALLTLLLGLSGTWKALSHKPVTYLRND